MLQVKCLTKSFKNKKVLKNISFEIKKGQIAIFLGDSGVGKSTLLRILNDLETYEKGYFYLDNMPLNLKKINNDHTIGIVFQHFNLFDFLPTYKNITLPLIKSQKKTKAEAISIANNLLKKYNLLQEQNILAGKLSGGQKQRLALARTLALNPQIICLDEPTSALDPKLTLQTANDIKQVAAKNRIIIISTHDISLVKHLNAQLFLMQDGKIVETSDTKNYFLNPESNPLIHQFFSDFK
jgi:polar amino acid transport system ATP-binding protein